jgi:biopolymer transport protein ExbD
VAISLGQSGGNGRRRYGGGIGTLSEINIIPLVDVVLVLLIIFMLTAHVMEFGLEINVPEVKQVKDTAEELPVVSVTRSGKIYLNESPVNINAISSEVQKRFKGAKSVYVRADKATVYDPIAQVISTLAEAHLDVKMVTKPIESSGNR